MGFLLDQNILLGLAAVSETGRIMSRCSTILRFSGRKNVDDVFTAAGENDGARSEQ
jgi:hypothetical protein